MSSRISYGVLVGNEPKMQASDLAHQKTNCETSSGLEKLRGLIGRFVKKRLGEYKAVKA